MPRLVLGNHITWYMLNGKISKDEIWASDWCLWNELSQEMSEKITANAVHSLRLLEASENILTHGEQLSNVLLSCRLTELEWGTFEPGSIITNALGSTSGSSGGTER